MTQQQLERAVARATGEPLTEIRRRGFGLLDPINVCFDAFEGDFDPQVVDWDDLAEHRPSLFP